MNGQEVTASQQHGAGDDDFEFGDFTSVSADAEEAAAWGFQVDDTPSARPPAHDDFGDFSHVEPYAADLGDYTEAADTSPPARLEISADEDFGAVTIPRTNNLESASPADDVLGNIESQDASDSVFSREVNFDSESMASSITTAFGNVIGDNRAYDDKDLDFNDEQPIPEDEEWPFDKVQALSQDNSPGGDSTEAEPRPVHNWDTSSGGHHPPPEKSKAAETTRLPPPGNDALAAEQPEFDDLHGEAQQQVQDASGFGATDTNENCAGWVTAANQHVAGGANTTGRHEDNDDIGAFDGGNEQVGQANSDSSTPQTQSRAEDANLGSSCQILRASCNGRPQMDADQDSRNLQKFGGEDLPSESRHDKNVGTLGTALSIGETEGDSVNGTDKVTLQAAHDAEESSALPVGVSGGSATDAAVKDNAEFDDFRAGDEAPVEASARESEPPEQNQARSVRHMADSSSPQASTNSIRDFRESSKLRKEIEQVSENNGPLALDLQPSGKEATGSTTNVHDSYGRGDLDESEQTTTGANAEIGATDAGPSGGGEKGNFELRTRAHREESSDSSGIVEMALHASAGPPTTSAAPSGDSEADLDVLGSAADTQHAEFGDFEVAEVGEAHMRMALQAKKSLQHGAKNANVDRSGAANDQRDAEVNTIGGSTEVEQSDAVSFESADEDLSEYGANTTKENATISDCGVTEEAMTQASAHIPSTDAWSSGNGEADSGSVEGATSIQAADAGVLNRNEVSTLPISTQVPATDALPPGDADEDFGKFEASTGDDFTAFGDFSGFEEGTSLSTAEKTESRAAPYGSSGAELSALEDGYQDTERSNSSQVDARGKHACDEAENARINDAPFGTSKNNLEATLKVCEDPSDREMQPNEREDLKISTKGDETSEHLAELAASSAPQHGAKAALGSVAERNVTPAGEVSASDFVHGETGPSDEDEFGDFGEAEQESADNKSGEESDFGEFGVAATLENQNSRESAKHTEERDLSQDAADDEFGDYDNATSAEFGNIDAADSHAVANDSDFGNFEAVESSMAVKEKAKQPLPQEESEAFGDFDSADFSKLTDGTIAGAKTVTNGPLKSLLREDVDLYERARILLHEAFYSDAAVEAVESDSKENGDQSLFDTYDERLSQLLSSNPVLSPPSRNLPSNLAAALLAALALSPAEEEEADRQRPLREVLVTARTDREDPRPASPTDGFATPYEGDDVAEPATASFPLDDLSTFLSDTSKPNAVAEAPFGAVSDCAPASASINTTQSTVSHSADDATWNFLESMSSEEPQASATRVLSEPSMFSLSRDTSTSGMDSASDFTAKPISAQFPSTESMQESFNLEDQILASLGVNNLDSGGLLGVPAASSPSPATSKNARKVTLNSLVDELPDYSFLLSKALVLPLQVSDSTDMESDSFWS